MAHVFSFVSIHPHFLAAHGEFGTFYWAKKRGRATFNFINLRDYGSGKHHRVDDRPYGGGDGMLLRPEPLAQATRELQARTPHLINKVIFPTPQGKVFTQTQAADLGQQPDTHFIFVCGRFGGADERWIRKYVDLELSLGDFVLAGGELPALAITEAILRTLPDVLGNQESCAHDSFGTQLNGRLEGAAYTRPEVFEGESVPATLLSGNHAHIRDWRQAQSEQATFIKRPDLL
ncbi:MAG: tRNA (guanosine(37)-N1)-methyltransferase TrmD [Zetaproteobacteria bacterium]|nr:tRNA (guanosine(37)-N1)-methyltransferase TrmD [Zetaproteobacteria bacterium]